MNAGNTANLTAQPAAPAMLSSTQNLSVISGAQKLAHILIKKGFKTGSSGNFDSQLNALIIVTLNRYQSASFGSYQKFSEIRNVGFSPIGPGRFTWKPAAQTVVIDYDTGYENKIILMVDGMMEGDIPFSFLADAQNAGFSFQKVNDDGTYHVAKYVSVNYTFSSNYTQV